MSQNGALSDEMLTDLPSGKPDWMKVPQCPAQADYRLLIEREWADLHHGGVQELSAVGVTVGAHIGILKLAELLHDSVADLDSRVSLLIGSLACLLFTIIGGLVTCRRRAAMRTQLNWIYDAEDRLGLVKKEDSPGGVIPESAKIHSPDERFLLAIPRWFSTSGLILTFYVAFGLCDLGVAILAWWALP